MLVFVPFVLINQNAQDQHTLANSRVGVGLFCQQLQLVSRRNELSAELEVGDSTANSFPGEELLGR